MEDQLLILDIAGILLTARLFAELASRFNIPAIIGELFAGILLGPSILGWIEPGDTLKATLINYDVSLAYRRICNQGAVSMACLGRVKSGNSECGCACRPHRARPEAHIYGVALVVKERAIHGEARLVAVRFRSRRDSS